MIWARRALGPIAAVWLVCQAATLALAPVLLEISLADCMCTHGADAMCPMHHKSAPGARVCVMQSANSSVPAKLNSLFSIAGLLPAPPLTSVPVPTAVLVPREYSTTTPRPSPPDRPPPRV